MWALDLGTPTPKWPGWSGLEKPTKELVAGAALAGDGRPHGLAFWESRECGR